ncbi:Hypothetical predicted protein [Olea europaea subsp. europaea]|uniref:Uncharacterized protein n=1 Tax=Olea europaea subsp. europaea TaxID=158383 RepID=A0A8S0RPZ6_OLEEU|nr:Hypothetical predicted protein [Olea europaea subsp. europaea]
MYAETGLMLPYLPQEIQQFDDFYSSQKPNGSLGNLIQTSTISDYNLGGEGDLFKAPEPVIEELMMGLDPISAAISMISCGEDVIFPQAMSVSDIESSIKNGQLLSEVFYECKKDLLEKEAYEMPLSELLDIKIPILKADEKLISEGQFQKSVSSSCLKSMEMHQAPLRQNFVDFPDSWQWQYKRRGATKNY